MGGAACHLGTPGPPHHRSHRLAQVQAREMWVRKRLCGEGAQSYRNLRQSRSRETLGGTVWALLEAARAGGPQ